MKVFEESYHRKFNIVEVPEATLEAQWSAAENPFDKTFAGLMLGMARGFDSEAQPPFGDFPMQMTSARYFIRNLARESASARASTVSSEASTTNGGAELR